MYDFYNAFEYQQFVSNQIDLLGHTQYPKEAYEFAIESYNNALAYHDQVPPPPAHIPITYDLTAYNFACCYVLHAKEVLIDAEEMLKSWGVISSFDIGEIVYALVKIGLFSESEHDSKEQFNSLFLVKYFFKIE